MIRNTMLGVCNRISSRRGPVALSLAILALTAVVSANRATAALINGDFETDAVSGVDAWTPVLGLNATVDQSSIAPHGGSLHVEAHMISPASQTGFAGVSQAGVPVTGGVDYNLTVYARLPDGETMMPNAPSYTGTSFVTVISWWDAGNNYLGQNSLFLTTEVTDSYQLFDLAATAPLTAATSQIFVFLQSGGLAGIDQTVWFDDVQFAAVPEPSTLLMALSAAGVLAVARLRRRSRCAGDRAELAIGTGPVFSA